MNKQDVLKQLERIPDDEPLFLLRAQDELAAELVELWAIRANALGVTNKVRMAFSIHAFMLRWPKRKVPD